MAKKERAALICRVSTLHQVELGLVSQVTYLRRKALEDGYEVPDNLIFQEQISGLDGNKEIRQSLKDLMSAVENHQVDVIYTYELSRISRDQYNLVERVKWFSDRKIPIYIYDAELWTLDRTTKNQIEETTNYIFDSANYGKIEVKRMKNRTMRAREELAQGGWYVGHLSDGYIAKLVGVSKKKIDIDENRRPIIERVFNLFIEGYSTDEIAQILNNEDVPTPNRYRLTSDYFNYNQHYRKKGGIEYERSKAKWQGAQIGQILTNEWYIGIRTYKGAKYKIPRIITDDVWQKTIEMRTIRAAQFRTHRNKRKHNYLLANYIFCGNCGRKMYGHYTGQNNHYFCSSFEEGEKCGLQGVCKENVEAIVCEMIKMRAIGNLIGRKEDVTSNYFKLTPQKITLEKNRIIELKTMIKGEEKSIQALEKRRIQFYSMMADGKDKNTIETLLDKDEKERQEHEVKIKKYLVEIDNAQQRINAGLHVDKIINNIEKTNDFQSLRQLIERTINRIEIYNVDKSISIIKIVYLNDKEDLCLYSYRLLRDKFVSLRFALPEVLPIHIEITKKSIIIDRGSIAFSKEGICSSVMGDEDKELKWYKDQISIRDFILNARKVNNFPFLYKYDRTKFEEEDEERKSEQKARYKELRKKYNTNLPTCVPYVVKDGNYEEYLEQRKHLYNRKYKIKKNKSLTDEQKAEELERIDEALSLLKAKVKYLNRDEAVKKFKEERNN